MLTDNFRMDFFAGCFDELIKPGSRVADLGAGTGILSFMAAARGASVTAVEYDIYNYRNLCRNIEANDLKDRVKALNADAKNIVLDEPQDFLICEMCHCGFMVEQQIPVINVFMRNHLKKFGSVPAVIPARAILEFDLINCAYEFRGHNIKSVHYQDAYSTAETGVKAYCASVIYYQADYYKNTGQDENIKASGALKIIRGGVINTLRLKLMVHQSVETWSFKKLSDFWALNNIHFPLENEIEVSAGAAFNYRLEYKAGCGLEDFKFSLLDEKGRETGTII
jgi:predicted RNA methylase